MRENSTLAYAVVLVQAFIAYWLQSLTVVLWVVELTIVLISVLMSNTDVEARRRNNVYCTK